MKLVHPDFLCQIELPEDRIPVLILENPSRFCQFVADLQRQIAGEEGDWVLSDSGKPLKIDKFCELILDPFSLDINQRKMITALYAQIEKEVLQTEMLLEWNQISTSLELAAVKLMSVLDDYELIYRDEINIRDFLKFMDVHFDVRAEELPERLIDYMRMSVDVLGTRLFILCNIKSFIDEQNMQYIYEQALYNKFHLLLVENHESEQINELERRIVIDKDDCLITRNDV